MPGPNRRAPSGSPSNWGEAVWLGVNTPRYALRVGAVLEAAFLGNIDPEI